MSLRASGLARMTSYGQHSSDTTCHTPVRESGTEASIRVPRMFNSHDSDNMIQMQCSIKHSNYLLNNDLWVLKGLHKCSGIKCSLSLYRR
jgi:hypothetical protein